MLQSVSFVGKYGDVQTTLKLSKDEYKHVKCLLQRNSCFSYLFTATCADVVERDTEGFLGD